MSDLISRKALIDIFQQKADGNSGLLRNNMLFAKKVVESMPTAYDVDKVVEQIEKISVYRSEYSEIVDCNIEIFGHCYGSCYECILNCVTDIVKGAVKDE